MVCKQKSEPKKERMSHPARYSRTDIRSRQPRLDGDRDDGGQIRPCAIGLGKGRASARGRGRTPEERPDLGIAKRKPPRQAKRECGGACVNLTEEVVNKQRGGSTETGLSVELPSPRPFLLLSN